MRLLNKLAIATISLSATGIVHAQCPPQESGCSLLIGAGDNYIGDAVAGGSSTSTGNVSNNQVTMTDGNVGGDLYAGQSNAGTVSGNSVILSGGTILHAVYGGHSATGQANRNRVTSQGGTVQRNLIGGEGLAGANDNIVEIQAGSNILQTITGGKSDGGAASGNSVMLMNGSTINQAVYGGYGQTGADNNQIHISGSTTTDIYGGFVQGASGVANNNTIVMNDGQTGQLLAGYGMTGVSQNRIEINKGTVLRAVSAGQARTGTADNNSVLVTGGTINSLVVAGQSLNGMATNNKVEVTGGRITGAVAGGAGTTAVNNNTAKISGTADIQGSVQAGGGQGPNATADANITTMSGGKVGGNLHGARASLQVTNNIVNLTGGQVTGSVYGGRSNTAWTSGNQVTISGDSVGQNVYGGAGATDATGNTVTMLAGDIGGDLAGGSGGGSVTGNTALINNGMIHGNVYGGAGVTDATGNIVTMLAGDIGGDLAGGSGGGSVTSNTVLINNGMIRGSVYGGHGTAGTATTTNNTITLQSGVINGGVYGGNYGKTGNTLNLHGFTGSVLEVNAFQYYSIVLPDSITNGGTMVHITGATPTDMSHTTVTNFQFAPGVAHYQAGDKMTLIDSATDDGSFADTTFTQVYKGPTAMYNVLVATENNALTATILGKSASPHASLLGNGRQAGLVFLNQGADLVAETGLNQAWGPIPNCRREGPVSLFTSLTYGKNKIVDHTNVDGLSFLAGLAWRNENSCDQGFMGGAFIEAGTGDYDGHSYKGGMYSSFDGDVKYYGTGLLSRYRFDNRLRVEGALRVGRLETDYKGVNSLNGLIPKYDLNTNYYGLYIGTGYDFDLTQKWNLDLSAKYFWMLQQGKTVSILNELVNFESTNSHRIKAGGRLSYMPANTVSVYAGAYYEHEFNGKVRAYNHSAALQHDVVDVKGSTGVFELGATITPAGINKLTVDFGLEGHAGKRDGYMGYINLGWTF